MKNFAVILVFFFTQPAFAQQVITLQQCYDLATVNYPLAKQPALLESQNKLYKKVLAIAKLPQLSLDAQATYQSDVIKFPIPNAAMQPINKDQYRATLSVNQLIYNGGATNASLDVESARLKTKRMQVEVSLYQLKQRINNLYFSILLAQETDLLLKAKRVLVQTKLSEVKSGIKYGALIPASDKILEAESLKIEQQLFDIESNKAVLAETISRIIGQTLTNSTSFQNPSVEAPIEAELKRPELKLFQIRKEEVERNEILLAKQNLPKLLSFATGGYGNPGLNILDNSFQPFYTVGVKLNWKFFDWDANKKQRTSLLINKEIIDTETETFKLNTNTELNQQRKEIEKMETFITSDLKIINLLKDVLKSADSQLKNGVISPSSYISELTNLYEGEHTLIKHGIQLQLAKANYNIIKGQ